MACIWFLLKLQLYIYDRIWYASDQALLDSRDMIESRPIPIEARSESSDAWFKPSSWLPLETRYPWIKHRLNQCLIKGDLACLIQGQSHLKHDLNQEAKSSGLSIESSDVQGLKRYRRTKDLLWKIDEGKVKKEMIWVETQRTEEGATSKEGCPHRIPRIVIMLDSYLMKHYWWNIIACASHLNHYLSQTSNPCMHWVLVAHATDCFKIVSIRQISLRGYDCIYPEGLIKRTFGC